MTEIPEHLLKRAQAAREKAAPAEPAASEPAASETPADSTTARTGPISSLMRRTRLSTWPAKPYSAPDCSASTVFLPIGERGGTSSTLRSWAARAASASSEIWIPGARAPPRKLPLPWRRRHAARSATSCSWPGAAVPWRICRPLTRRWWPGRFLTPTYPLFQLSDMKPTIP